MGIILLIIIAFAIALVMFCLYKTDKIRAIERKKQEAMKQEVSERIMRPERKLHEEEKKRWEDEYYKRQ